MKNRFNKFLIIILMVFMMPVFTYAIDEEPGTGETNPTCDSYTDDGVTVKFADCEGCADKTVNHENFEAGVTLPSPTKEGYTLKGFKIDGNNFNGGKLPIDMTKKDHPDCKYTYSKTTVTITAVWQKDCAQPDENKITVNFDANGGKEISSVSVTDGKLPELPKAEKKGYIFKNWTFSSGSTASSGASIGDNKSAITDDDGCTTGFKTTLKAVYECDTENNLKNKVTVNFNTDGGSEVKSVQVVDKVDTLSTPTKKGYTFTGWFIGETEYKAGTKLTLVENKASDGCVLGYKDITLTAHWEKVVCPPLSNNASITVNFVTNGGSNVASQTVCVNCGNSGSNVSIPTTKKPKFIFNGWYYDKNFKTIFSGADLTYVRKNYTYDDNGCETGYAPVTLYAKFEPITCPPYTGDGVSVRFNTFGGTQIDSIKVCVDCEYEDGKAPKVEDPVKEGYVFEGWYYDQSFFIEYIGEDLTTINKDAVMDSNDCITDYKDVTLYAKFGLADSDTSSLTTNMYNYNKNGTMISMGLGVLGLVILGVSFAIKSSSKSTEPVEEKPTRKKRPIDEEVDD